MLPDQWVRVQSVFLSVADLPPEEQAGLLDKECGDDADLRSEVESLLASDRESARAISSVIAVEAELVANHPGPQANPVEAYVRRAFFETHQRESAKCPREGQLIGQWRLIRELGEGGMGSVFLAERADQQYELQAAIKLVRRGLDTDFILHRFRRERQILARLEHPNITRMLDGGTTSDGIPYFVMEYVDGLWITRHADQHKLDVEKRIRLCLPVCAAVAYAHRNFIVHRDLKPGNILIDSTGVPKLLDFGISKLLHSDQPDAKTTRGGAMMTPDYASPEQILGDPVTPLSDVSSLGAVIYELLTGTRPYRFQHCSLLALERAICQESVVPPSVAVGCDRAIVRKLKGDLDNIILCAMQKEPARRYASVEYLADDLRRFLEHRPVQARPDSSGYRIGKFVRRNRATVSLGAVAATAILIGGLAAIQEARIAQQRFEDVRKLATAFVFDVEDAVRPLPGSTRARQLIAHTGVDYLSRLSRSSAGDWDLKRELASAWLRIGIVQDGQDSSNLNDSASALVSFGTAGRLLDDVLRYDPSDTKAAIDRVKVSVETSDVQWSIGLYREALASAEQGLQIAGLPMLANGKNPEAIRYTGLLHLALERLRQRDGDLVKAEAEAECAARLLRPAAEANPSNRDAQLSLANLDARLGSINAVQERRADALASYRSEVSVLEGLCRRDTVDTRSRRQLMFAYSHVGDTLANSNANYNSLGDLPGAFQAYGKMTEQAKFLYDADPADTRALGDYGIAMLRRGRVAPRSGPDRRAMLESSRELLDRAAAGSPQNRDLSVHLIWVENELGNYAAAISKGERFLSSKSFDMSVVRLLENAVRPLAEEQARGGRRAEALSTLDHSLELANKATVVVPQTSQIIIAIARAWHTAGSVYAILATGETGQRTSADREVARTWYRRALLEWRKLEHDKAFVAP